MFKYEQLYKIQTMQVIVCINQSPISINNKQKRKEFEVYSLKWKGEQPTHRKKTLKLG